MICASPLIQPWQHKTTAMRCFVFCGTQHTHQTETTSTQPEQATTAKKQKRAAFPPYNVRHQAGMRHARRARPSPNQRSTKYKHLFAQLPTPEQVSARRQNKCGMAKANKRHEQRNASVSAQSSTSVFAFASALRSTPKRGLRV